MKKSIFLFFAAILCASSVWAADMNSAEIYYDNTASQWSDVQLFVGKNDWNSINPMKKISNTNNLYCLYNFSWGGYSAFYFTTGTASWNPLANNENVDSRSDWATCRSAKQTTSLGSTVNLYISTAATKGASVTRKTLTDYKSLNYKQTVQQQLTTDGSTYSASTEAIATIKVASYRLASATATSATAQNGTIASGSSSANCEAARTATVTYSVSGINSSYSFVGWYDGDTQKSTSATYTYQATEAKTITARFAVATEEEHEVAVSYMCGTTKVADGATAYVGVETEKSFTAPTNITGYKFTNWTIGAGIDLKAGSASDATITVVTKSASSGYTLVANYEEVMETVYFINTNKWARVNIHKWNGKAADSSWPGEQLTASGEKIGEYDVYSYTAKQGDYAKIIFNSKTSGTDDGNAQTGDLTWTAGKYYIYNYGGKSDWYTKEEAEELLVVPVVTHDIVVKAVVPAAWTSTTIGIYYWGEGISGTSTPVATEKDGNWNKYTIKNVPEGVSVNVIFLNGTSWPDDKSNQTADITGITEDKCFQISAAKLDSDGKCTVKEVDCDATIEPEVDVYTIMGAGELGLSWDLATTGNDMTKQTDGTYTLVKEGLDLATTGSYEYKVVKNHSWDWSIPTGTDNQTLKVDKDGTYTVTFTLSSDKTKLTADAECTAEKEVILDCFVAGTTNLVGGTTDFTDELPMTYDEGTKTYSKTFTALAAGNYQMKVVYGSDWLGYDKLTKPVPANVTEGDDKKIQFTLAEAGDVTVTYHATNGIGLTGNFAAPAPDVIKYVLMGINGDWTTGIELTQNPSDENEYMLLNQTITRATDAIKVVTLTNGTATAWCGDVDEYSDAIYENNWENDGNIELEDGIYNFYFKVSDKKIYIDQTTLLRTGTNKYGTIYIPYTPASVSGATFYQVAGKGTEDGQEGVYLESVDKVEAGKPYIYERTGNHVVKIVFSGDKATNGGAVNGLIGTDTKSTHVPPHNYLLINNAFCKSDGSSKVRGYRAYLDLNAVTGGKPQPMPGRRYIGMSVQGENEATGLDNITNGENTTIKLIENGQLIIIRNGEKFNAQGVRF